MTTMSMEPGSGYTIALLDTGTMLQRDIIPSLVERHFGVCAATPPLYVSVSGRAGRSTRRRTRAPCRRR